MPDWAWEMVTYWQLFRGGGMGGGHLPSAVMAEPSLMIACFCVMSACQANLEDKNALPLNEDGVVDTALLQKRADAAFSSWELAAKGG